MTRPLTPARHALRLSLNSLACACALALLPAQAQAPADVRVALVIGNGAYEAGALANPANDARAMSETLRTLGFDVVEVRDAKLEQMREAVRTVSRKIDGRKAAALFYYAGHGLQLDWHNYLVPVNARLRDAGEVPRQTLDIAEVVDAFKNARTRINVLVLDACRDNPFGGTASGKGLAQMDAPPGTFLAYATGPGNVADDGTAGNGLYTQFLLRELAKPASKIEDVFKRTRWGVRNASQGRQIPWESTSLEDDFYFRAPAAATLTPEEQEKLFQRQLERWTQIQKTTDLKVLEAFLVEFPSGSFSELALFRYNRLQKLAAEQANADMEKRKAEEQARLAEAERRRMEEERRLQVAREAAERARAEEQARAAEAERRRIEEERRLQVAREAAERARAEEQARAALAAQLAEQARQAQERAAAQRAAAERARAEEEAQRLAQQQAQARARAEEEARRLAEARARLAEEERQAALAREQREREAARAREETQARARAEADARARAELLAAQQRPHTQQAQPSGAPPRRVLDSDIVPLERNYRVGVEAEYHRTRWSTKEDVRQRQRITRADIDSVEINDGRQVWDGMGNVLRNDNGSFSAPRQFYPAEFQVGKRWNTRVLQDRSDGQANRQLNLNGRIVKRERIKVPAGEFDTYLLVISGYEERTNGDFPVEWKIWVAPELPFDVSWEFTRRNPRGEPREIEIRKLTSLKL